MRELVVQISEFLFPVPSLEKLYSSLRHAAVASTRKLRLHGENPLRHNTGFSFAGGVPAG